jgi:transglutaminase-like putative cysteine protease
MKGPSIMRLETVFRLSTYLTLALATLCLSSAEELFMSGMRWFVLPIELLLVVAFAVEGRWALAPLASNIIGLLIAAGSGIWIACSLIVPPNQFLEAAPYPAALLPYGGPVLMVLMLAKLFRPKQINDFWVLHSIGLMQVALGCILAGEPEFSAWLFAYLACVLWSLMLFYLCRELRRANPQAAGEDSGRIASALRVEASPGQVADAASAFRILHAVGSRRVQVPRRFSGATARGMESPAGPGSLLPWRGWGFWSVGRRAVVSAGLGFALFLLAPRNSERHWNLLAAAHGENLETGYSYLIDLNYTGTVKESDHVAMVVYVEDADGRPKLDSNPEQRWRGGTLDYYKDGRWMGRHRSPPSEQHSLSLLVPPGERGDLPNLGPQTVLVTFDLELRRAGGLFLAEPVPQLHQGKPPVCSVGEPSWVPYFHPRDATLIPPTGPVPRGYRYRQVFSPVQEQTPPGVDVTSRYRERLLQQLSPRLRSWTNDVLQQLVSEQHLTPEHLATAADQEIGPGRYLLPQNRAKVAQALADYLAFSGAFSYRLEMRRHDLAMDPIEDFLLNIRQGYCEHYASSLTLMLRAVGIPARVVNGFRGADSAGPAKEGYYYIRQNHAHSWVEALMPRSGRDGKTEFYWLVLDPTPAREFRPTHGLSWSRWWGEWQSSVRDLWKGLILDYNLETQVDAAAALWTGLALDQRPNELVGWFRKGPLTGQSWAARWTALAIGPAVLLAGWWFRRARRHRSGSRKATASSVVFYDRYLKVVSRRCGLAPQPSHTPLEFASLVSRTLRTIPAVARLAELPPNVAHLYYRIRYGGRPLFRDEEADIDRHVTELDTALT